MLVAYCEKTMSSDISTDDARSLALKWACPFFECCATDSKRLEEVLKNHYIPFVLRHLNWFC